MSGIGSAPDSRSPPASPGTCTFDASVSCSGSTPDAGSGGWAPGGSRLAPPSGAGSSFPMSIARPDTPSPASSPESSVSMLAGPGITSSSVPAALTRSNGSPPVWLCACDMSLMLCSFALCPAPDLVLPHQRGPTRGGPCPDWHHDRVDPVLVVGGG